MLLIQNFEINADHQHLYQCLPPRSSLSLNDHIRYIRENAVDAAMIYAGDLGFLRECQTLRYVMLYPTVPPPEGLDAAPLYELPEVRFLWLLPEFGAHYAMPTQPTRIDYRRIRGLWELWLTVLDGAEGYDQLPELEYLRLDGFPGKTLTELNPGPKLKTLRLLGTSIRSLTGIERAKSCQRLVICRGIALRDISPLVSCGKQLTTLALQSCPKVQDYAPLGQLKNLQHLELTDTRSKGMDISFLRGLEKLQVLQIDGHVRSRDPAADLAHLQELEVLNIEIPGVQDTSFLRTMKKLRVLRLGGEILDPKFGRNLAMLPELECLEFGCQKMAIASLSFLRYLHKLQWFSYEGDVLDGDISPCLGIPFARIRDRRHFSHKNRDLSKARVKIQSVGL